MVYKMCAEEPLKVIMHSTPSPGFVRKNNSVLLSLCLYSCLLPKIKYNEKGNNKQKSPKILYSMNYLQNPHLSVQVDTNSDKIC